MYVKLKPEEIVFYYFDSKTNSMMSKCKSVV